MIGDTNSIIASVAIFGVIGLLGYYYFAKAEGTLTSRAGSFLLYGSVILAIGFGLYFFVTGFLGDRSRSNNLASTPVDSVSTVVVPADQTPPASGVHGGNYGLQFWMFIQDWDYKFGERKPVIRRGMDGIYNPFIYLHPTENTLTTEISVFSGDDASPAAADSNAAGDSFKCNVQNVPLQKWTAVSMSVSGRNVDIYLDGLLVRSCLLPGVPRSPKGSIEIMPGGGFSGNVVDVYHYSRALVPADAQAFAAAGTTATSYNALPSKSWFGYQVKVGVVDDAGKEIKKYVF